MPEQAKEDRIKKLLQNFPEEKFVGMSGLALLCGATVFALSGDPNAALLGSVGSNVLAAMLQQHFESVRDLPTRSDDERLARLAKTLTPAIQQNGKLRKEVGDFLQQHRTAEIANAVVAENPVQGWLLTQTYHEVLSYRDDFNRIYEVLAKMMSQIKSLTRDEGDEALIPYLDMVVRRSEMLPISPLDPTGGERVNIALNEVFVSLKVGAAIALGMPEIKGKTWMVNADAALAYIHEKEQFILLGDAGSGKSTLLRFLSFCLAQHQLKPESGWLSKLQWKTFFADLEDAAQRAKQPGQTLETFLRSSQSETPEPIMQQWQAKAPIPVLIELREFALSAFDPESPHALWRYVETSLSNEEVDDAIVALKKKAQCGELLLMLDGVDEVPNEKRKDVWQAIKSLRQGPYGGNRWIVTCRVLSFVKEEAPIGVMVQTLQALNQEQIDLFIENWTDALRKRGELTRKEAKTFQESLQGAARSRLEELASNPMLLTIIVLVQKFHGTLPKERAKLYEACVEIMMLRWQHHKEKVKGQAALSILNQLGIEEKNLEKLLWEIAWEAHTKNPQAKGSADILQSDLLRILQQPKYFGVDMERVGKFMGYTEKRSHLLIYKGTKNGEPIYTFPHRTFQEFLAARYLLTNKKERRKVAKLAAMGAPWREVLNLAAGYLFFRQNDDERVIELIEKILPDETPEIDEVAGWHQVWIAGEIAAIVGTHTMAENEKQKLLTLLQVQLGELLTAGVLTPQQRAEIGLTLSQLGDKRPDVDRVVPQMVKVPAGPFWMGSDKEKDPQAYSDELSQHEVITSAYRIGKYPVTNAQFARFVQAGGYEDAALWTKAGWRKRQEEGWTGPRYAAQSWYNQANQPVVGISWYEAVAYCKWLSRREGRRFRLPDEAMWEKAARGTDGRIYPWGNDWNPEFLNVSETNINRPSAVGIFPQGQSPYGAHDMSGNVWEWCSTAYGKDYPFWPLPYEQEVAGEERRRLRGGGFNSYLRDTRVAYRLDLLPHLWLNLVGFRVAEHLSDPAPISV